MMMDNVALIPLFMLKICDYFNTLTPLLSTLAESVGQQIRLDIICCEAFGVAEYGGFSAARVFGLVVDGKIWGSTGPTTKAKMKTFAADGLQLASSELTWVEKKAFLAENDTLLYPVRGWINQSVRESCAEFLANQLAAGTQEILPVGRKVRL